MTKYNKGDRVKIIKYGSGYADDCIGEIVTVLEYKDGGYCGRPAIRTTKTKGNSNANDGTYGGFCGANSVILVAPLSWKERLGGK